MDTARNESTASAKPLGRLGELTYRLPDVGRLHVSSPHHFHPQPVLHEDDIAAAALAPQVKHAASTAVRFSSNPRGQAACLKNLRVTTSAPHIPGGLSSFSFA